MQKVADLCKNGQKSAKIGHPGLVRILPSKFTPRKFSGPGLGSVISKLLGRDMAKVQIFSGPKSRCKIKENTIFSHLKRVARKMSNKLEKSAILTEKITKMKSNDRAKPREKLKNRKSTKIRENRRKSVKIDENHENRQKSVKIVKNPENREKSGKS